MSDSMLKAQHPSADQLNANETTGPARDCVQSVVG